jgi:DNA-directed RNA polymerase specialized sigma24 family protein
MMSSPIQPKPASTQVEVSVVYATGSFEEFFRQTHTRLFGGLCLMTGNRHEAEEIMQDAYLKVWERWERVEVMDEPWGSCSRPR